MMSILKNKRIKKLLDDKISAAAFIVIVIYLCVAMGCELYSVYCKIYNRQPIYNIGNIKNRFEPPSIKYIMGTDYQGRSVFWRALFSIRTAVKIGVIASLLSACIGVILGVTAGYYGGCLDDLINWLYSVFASLPTLLFILAFALLVNKGFLTPGLRGIFEKFSVIMNIEPGMMAIYLGIGFTGWVGLCRIIRAETMKIKETAFVQSAKTLGFSSLKIIFFYIIPNLSHIIIIYVTLRFAYAVMTEVIVSYLGLGVQMEPSWGIMIAEGQTKLWQGIWWEVSSAAVFMFLLVLSLHILGDKLRDVLDPKSI